MTKNKEYRENHIDEIKQYKNQYYQVEENKKTASEYQKVYRENHKEESKKYYKQYH